MKKSNKDTHLKQRNHELVDERGWENPMDPENTSDERDIEQVKRQRAEAKRLKKNLTENK